VTRWFVLPRFGSCKPTPRWGGHKDRVSFNPFPLSNGHLDRVSFSLQSNVTLSPLQGPPQLGVSCFDYNWVENKKGGRRKAKLSLLVTIAFEWNWYLERFWFTLIVSCIECTSSCIECVGWNLDALKCGSWGVFIAPTTKVAVREGCCRWAHWTVRCATGHCPVRQPRHTTVRVQSLELWHVRPPDSPVVHRTVTVHCPVHHLRLL
jgi:hypothetical protein